MALPTLQAAYRPRNNPASFIAKRNRDSENHERACVNAGFFQWNDMLARQKQEWESKASFKNSMNSYMSGAVRHARAVNLENRRLQLSQLLTEEMNEFEAELKQLKLGIQPTLRDLVEQCDSLRSAREMRRKQLAEQKLYDHWKSNNPDLRKVESDENRKHVVQSWSKQIQEHKQNEAALRLAEEEEARRMEEERQIQEDLEQEREIERMSEARRLRQTLEDQMYELKQREAETAQLKADESLLMRERAELEELEEERRKREVEIRRSEHGRILLRQHTAALRRKSQIIQQQLEEDRRLLNALTDQEERERHIESARRDRAVADVQWMKKVIEDQLHTEKIREAELDLLYQEEAARMWEQREREWEKEKRAREQLMSEVLRDRQAQIAGRMEEVRRQQEEGLERRQDLLDQLIRVKQLSDREQEQRADNDRAHRVQLEQQMEDDRGRREEKRLQQRVEQEEQERSETRLEQRLQDETSRISAQIYQPKRYGRKQAWM